MKSWKNYNQEERRMIIIIGVLLLAILLSFAEEEVKRPFPQATELTEKSKRLAVLEGLLNMNDKDIVTDTEPEQQCQTDNRQRGQEER